ncbi:PAP2-domain-containing protein [Phellopilus nigrolimitatus]|nr:PAP2-domain-containing protein [Phellopilus nigrolimitatus]
MSFAYHDHRDDHSHEVSSFNDDHEGLNNSYVYRPVHSPEPSFMAWFTIRSEEGFTPRAGMTRRRRIALLTSYFPDWIVSVVLAAAFFSLDKVPGFKREFSIDDPTLRFPFATKERVPPIALYFIAIVAPFVLQIVVNLLSVRSLWDFHNSTLGLLLSLSMTGVITQFTKITVGRPRPDVISRCQPHPGVTNPEYGLVTSAICTQMDVHILRDGWRSFPSGHSSLVSEVSFAGLGFLAFYLAGKLHLFDEKGHATRAWISLTPLAGAALVAISRTMDYRHHWQDVLVGSALGFVMAFFAYRLYFPPLTSALAHRPYSPRVPHELEGRPPRPSESEAGAPILPTVRPPARTGNSGRSGSSRGDGEGELAHPAVPHVHGVGFGPGHAYSQYSHYRDELSTEDLQRAGEGAGAARGHTHRRDESDDVEMDGRPSKDSVL